MKKISIFALVLLASAMMFQSCNKEEVAPQEIESVDDSALLKAIYESEVLTDKGEVKDDGSYSFAIPFEDLSESIQTQLEDKKTLEINNPINISGENLQRIWGDKMNSEALERGIQIQKGAIEVNQTYMDNDGNNMEEAVLNDPTILDRKEIINYLVVAVVVIETEDAIIVGVYAETCTIIIN